jgi:hypothetical protein
MFENQQTHIPPAILDDIGAILSRHGMTDRYGVSILHTHYVQDLNTVMLHQILSTGDEISTPRRRESLPHDIVPRHSRLTRNGLITTEYAIGQNVEVPSDVLVSELASFLEQHKLDQVLGLSFLTDPKEARTEYLLPSQHGTVAVIAGSEFGSGVTTEWAFRHSDGNLRVIPVTECKPTATGAHEPKSK